MHVPVVDCRASIAESRRWRSVGGQHDIEIELVGSLALCVRSRANIYSTWQEIHFEAPSVFFPERHIQIGHRPLSNLETVIACLMHICTWSHQTGGSQNRQAVTIKC